MEAVDLKVELREKVGGNSPKQLRKEGYVPGIVYGNSVKPFNVQIEKGELEHLLHSSSSEHVMVNLKVDGDESKNCIALLKDVQHHMVADAIIHVDFQAVSMEEEMDVNIPVKVKGEAKGVTEGGLLEIVQHELEIRCLPANIPEVVVVDVADLGLNESIHVKDLNLPEGVKCLDDPDTTVVVVTSVEEVSVKTEESEEGGEPEVIRKSKEDKE